MIYIFEDGRTVYREENLNAEDKGYIAAERTPDVPPKDGKVGYCYADVEKQELLFGYLDAPLEVPQYEPWQQARPQKPPVTLEEIKELQLIIMGALADIGGDM